MQINQDFICLFVVSPPSSSSSERGCKGEAARETKFIIITNLSLSYINYKKNIYNRYIE